MTLERRPSRAAAFARFAAGRRTAQRGVSLVFSMITLVALSLAAVALIRSVDTGVGILGNLSFKQDTLLASDDATRQALAWLSGNVGSAALQNDVVASGYSASAIDNIDFFGNRDGDATRVVVDWAMDDCAGETSGSYARCFKPAATQLSLANGVTGRYLIMRMCDAPGDPASNTIRCAAPLRLSATESPEKNEQSYSSPRLEQNVRSQYYRVIVRTQGGRNTSSITETVVHY